MNPPVRAGELTSVGDWARWDAAGHRTIYAASAKRYAYQEVLAYLTPAQSLQHTAMSEVFDDVDEHAGSVLEAIAKEWEGQASAQRDRQAMARRAACLRAQSPSVGVVDRHRSRATAWPR